MVKIFELLQRGVDLTVEERINVITTKFKGLTLDTVEFIGGTTYSNPIHLAGALTDGSYLLFVDEKDSDPYTVYKASPEIRVWLLNHRHNTSYGAIEEYRGRH